MRIFRFIRWIIIAVVLISAGITALLNLRTKTYDLRDGYSISAKGSWKDVTKERGESDLTLMTSDETMMMIFDVFSKEDSGMELAEFASTYIAKEETPIELLDPVTLGSYSGYMMTATEPDDDGDTVYMQNYILEADGSYIFGTGFSYVEQISKTKESIEAMLSSLKKG